VIEKAEDLGVRGTVANRADGSVECVAEGPRDALESLIQSLRHGPGTARVDSVEVLEQPFRGDLPEMRVTW